MTLEGLGSGKGHGDLKVDSEAPPLCHFWTLVQPWEGW